MVPLSCIHRGNSQARESTGNRHINQRHAACNTLGLGIEATQTGQLMSDLIWAQHGPRASGFDGADRHAGETRSSRVLCKSNAAGFLDRPHAQGAIGASSGENHADSASAEVFGERDKQRVSWIMALA